MQLWIQANDLHIPVGIGLGNLRINLCAALKEDDEEGKTRVTRSTRPVVVLTATTSGQNVPVRCQLPSLMLDTDAPTP